MKKLLLISMLCIIYIFIPNNAFCDRGITGTGNSIDSARVRFIQQPNNSKTKFNDFIQQNMYIFLTGNNEYSPDSEFPGLSQCLNDIRLVSRIFSVCCKVNEANIHMLENATLSEFNHQFSEFTGTMDKDGLFIFYFSGHGGSDGSLVFTDGKKIKPEELRNKINSIPNDSVIIIDACYAGNNEGPLEFLKNEQPYKNNCIRIYASLAHLTAKEINYRDSLFEPVLPFFTDVLDLENIDGNGYFTALYALFFAQYQFKKNENISFYDLVYYITNNGNIFTETLEAAGQKDIKISVEQVMYGVNQNPKILPADKNISFLNPEHEYIILQKRLKRFRPAKDHVSASINTQAVIPLSPYNQSLNIGIMPGISLLYNINVGWGIIGIGIQTGTYWTRTLDDEEIEYPFNNLIYPLTLNIQYCTDFPSPLYFLLDAGVGLGLNHVIFDDNTQLLGTKFLVTTGISAGFNLLKNLGLSGSLYYTLALSRDYAFHMLSPGLKIMYNF